MKNFAKFSLMILAAASSIPAMSAKDFYVSADGSDSNDGLTAATPKATLTGLTEIMEKNSTVHIKGMLRMQNEIPEGFDPGEAVGAGDLNLLQWAGRWASHDKTTYNGVATGKKVGFNIASRGDGNWQGITFVGEDPEEDGFDGEQEVAFFIVRGRNNGGTTFRNLSFVNGNPHIDGGTFYIKDEAVVNFDNCLFENNHVNWEKDVNIEGDGLIYKIKSGGSERGGALRIESNSSVNITNTRFIGNVAKGGGAIMITGTTASKDSEDIPYIGGNPANEEARVYIYNCDFEDNSNFGIDDNDDAYLDATKGGAICVWSLNASSYVTIDQCRFSGNGAWQWGGAISVYQDVAYGHLADVTISNCSFFENQAQFGGALSVRHSHGNPAESKKYPTNNFVKVINSTFAFNESRDQGGAIYLEGGMKGAGLQNDVFYMANCTVFSNSTRGNSGHGAGYTEKSTNDNSIDNVDRYFYNCLFEANEPQGVESPEYSDFTTASSGAEIAYCHIGKIVPIDGETTDNIKEFITESQYDFAMDEDGVATSDDLRIYNDMLSTSVWMQGIPFFPLPEESELAGAGNPEYLQLADGFLMPIDKSLQHNVNGQLVKGYDISGRDQLGFPRQEGACVIGAAEVDVNGIIEYLEGKDLPYISSGVNEIFVANGKSVCIVRDGDLIACEGAIVEIYNMAGNRVAAGLNGVSIASLAKGIYVVNARTANGKATAKIIK